MLGFLPLPIYYEGDGNPPPGLPESSDNIDYWQGYPGPAGYLDIEEAGLFALGSGAILSDLLARSGYGYLLRARVPVAGPTESYVTFYPAASFSRSSASNDVPADTFVPGSLLDSTINYEIKLFAGIEPEAAASGGQGAIVLVDPRGDLDYLIDYPWDGAQLDILQGPFAELFKNYAIVGKLTTAGILYDPRRKEFRLRDQADRLQKAGLHDQKYGGTGGADGIPELEGVYKPYGVGSVFNTEPILIDPPRQIRQLSCSKINSVQEVRDGGSVITATGTDYPTYAALAAAADATAIPAGFYSTCLNEGMIATGSIPVLQLTADFEGDATVINGTGYVDRIAGIVRRVVTGRGDLKLQDSDIDYASLNELDSNQPDVCGWWWRDHVTKAEALKTIMDSRLGWWAVRLNGLLAVGVMDDPVQAPVMVVNYPEDFAGEPRQMDAYQVPRRETYIGYRWNYTVQDASRLSGEVIDPGDGLVYGQESSYARSTDTLPLWLWPTAQTVKINGGFATIAAAQTEADRQQRVMEVRRERWTLPVPCSPFADVLGKVIQVNNYPRYGWGAARKFICVGVSFASGIAVTLDLWG